MSVNTTHGMNPDKVRRFGKYFGTIDFDVADNPTKLALTRLGNDFVAGTFRIDGREYSVTLGELDRIIETCTTAKHVLFQKYRFGK